MIITLGTGYQINISHRNYTLQQNCVTIDEDGNEKTFTRTHGYFSNLHDALDRYVLLSQVDAFTGANLTASEYMHEINTVNARTVECLERLIDNILFKDALIQYIRDNMELCQNDDDEFHLGQMIVYKELLTLLNAKNEEEELNDGNND